MIHIGSNLATGLKVDGLECGGGSVAVDAVHPRWSHRYRRSIQQAHIDLPPGFPIPVRDRCCIRQGRPASKHFSAKPHFVLDNEMVMWQSPLAILPFSPLELTTSFLLSPH